jgi:uncharacterized protein YjlB
LSAAALIVGAAGLALALKQGDPTVIMRGLGDVEMHPMEMASFRKLFH